MALLAGHRARRGQGMSEHYPTELRTKDGDVVAVLVSVTPLRDEDGRFAGALAMVTDVNACGTREGPAAR